jgi:hypothetical protein
MTSISRRLSNGEEGQRFDSGIVSTSSSAEGMLPQPSRWKG